MWHRVHALSLAAALLAISWNPLTSQTIPVRGPVTIVDPEAIDFSTVAHISMLPDGRMVMSLRSGSHRVAVVGPGRSVKLIARQGEGPGEAAGGFPALVGVTGGDIWVGDHLKRLFLVSPEGRLQRNLQWPTEIRDEGGASRLLGRGLLRAVASDGSLIVSGTSTPANSAAKWSADLSARSEYLLQVGQDGRLIRRIAAAEQWKCNSQTTAQPLYCPKLLYEVSPDGRWAVAIEPTAVPGQVRRTVTRIGQVGGSTATLTLPADRITEATKDSIRKVLASYSDDPTYVASTRTQPIVDHRPGAGQLIVASDGSHLIRTGTSGPDAVWYLFRADGGKLGELILPLSFQVKMMLLGAVVGVQTDEDDVESVVRYSFTVGR